MNTLVISDAELGAEKPPAPGYYTPPAHGWTCFHCGDTFTDERSARTHFGPTPDSSPGCIIKMQAGDRSLLHALRVVEAERDELRRQQCEEDSELHRALHAKSAEMVTAVRRAEDQGYARGLEDAKKYPETLGLTRAALGGDRISRQSEAAFSAKEPCD